MEYKAQMPADTDSDIKLLLLLANQSARSSTQFLDSIVRKFSGIKSFVQGHIIPRIWTQNDENTIVQLQ